MIHCEICESNDIVKQEGLFVCQNCGAKYSLEEIKKITNSSSNVLNDQNKIEKLLKNGMVLFNDNKFDEAYNYFTEILKLDPENYIAHFYKGISSAWKSSMKGEYYVDVARGATRASEYAKEILGETKELSDFYHDCFEQLKTFLEFGEQVYTNYYSKEVDSCSKRMEELKKESNRYGINGPHELYAEMAKEITGDLEHAKEIHDAGIGLVLSVYSVSMQNMIKILDNKELLSINEYQNIIAFSQDRMVLWLKYIDKDSQLNLGALILLCVNNVKAIKKERVNRFWENHKEEKEKYEKDIKDSQEIVSEKEKKLIELKKQKNLYKEKIEAKTSSENELESIQQKISELEYNKNSLGLFKRKEKDELQEQIDQLKQESYKLGPAIDKEKQSLKDEYQILIEDVDDEIEKLQKEIDDNIEIIKRNNSILEKLRY